ncbi:alanine acetyltransferase [Salipiger pallidus]|uniref:Alanine acetyltransferase n=1 Tax=Salipiger pallidus TaxID=1775170 RepID=A0A8J3EG03_9RHOB|nr:GNAT family N-acetyltransferase [Salipiger pallidus]GGG67937.1 alanine acetyltransferase [Salipiger pallidus]
MTAAEIAAISARAYQHMSPWSEADIAGTLDHPLTVLSHDGASFALGRVIVDEAEILALATDPGKQRGGGASRALAAFHAEAMARGAVTCFLEVAADNAPAIAFYETRGYARTGLRKGYYPRAGSAPADALLMARALP